MPEETIKHDAGYRCCKPAAIDQWLSAPEDVALIS